MKRLPLVVVLALSTLSNAAASGTEKIIAAGSAITETVFALGCGDQVVGVDLSSVYPAGPLAALPKVGYFRQLGAEGVLSLGPTLLLCGEDAGPPAALAQIENAGVRVVRLSVAHSPEAAVERIIQVGEILGVSDRARLLADRLAGEIKESSDRRADASGRPSVIFVMSHGGGTPNVSGTGTAAHAMIELAGGRNVMTSYDGYKLLTAESAIAAAPDVILTTNRSLGAVGGEEGLLKSPGLAHTPAGTARRVVVMDDVFLLGFGPRLGEAVQALERELHGPAPALSAHTSHSAP